MYSALKLISILIGFIGVFYLSGAACLRYVRRPTLSLGLAAGLNTGIIFAMITSNINSALVLQAILAMSGLYRLFKAKPRSATKSGTTQRRHQNLWPELSVFTTLLFVFSCLLMSDPISDWDARSIWFYHAKVIYHTKDIWAHGHWAEQANIYTHLNYPKLFALLAAQIASVFGFWNEYVPKLAIALLAAPVLAFFVELALNAQHQMHAKLVNCLLLFVMLFMFDGAGFYLTSGYMDGWVALYSICAAMSLRIAIQHQHSDDCRQSWIQALVFLTILPQIKQEGLIISLIFLMVTLALSIVTWPISMAEIKQFISSTTFKTFRAATWPREFSWYSLFLLGPIIAWFIATQKQGLSLSHYSGNTIERIAAKLAVSGQPTWILANAILHNSIIFPSLVLALILTIIGIASRKRPVATDFLPLCSGLIYLGVICMVYLATNADVNWHMAKSAGRVGLTPGLLIATFNYRCIMIIFFTDKAVTRQS